MKKTTLNELNEMYKDAPKRTAEYEIDGKKFIVTSHFVGTKNLDKYFMTSRSAVLVRKL